jgi:serine/threonine protein kinase
MSDTESTLNAPLLLDRYQPTKLLARGGSASVFQGHDQLLGRDVAIKLFRGGTATHIAQYHEELRVLASLSHHGVVTIIDAGVDESLPVEPHPFLVMELVTGSTIADVLKTRELSTREIGEIGFEIAEALEYVHAQGVIHRDITPSNVMLVNYGTASSRQRARLTDFGIAIDSESNGHDDGSVTGTAAYLSPEQVANAPLTTATDIYSLGLVLLECFTHERTFPGTAVESALARMRQDPPTAGVPEPWRSLIQAMTTREPLARPTAATLTEQMRLALRAEEPAL